ncbi:hypothetical protein SAMN04487914_108130 [Arthrobacter sp. ok909]|uniref:hypothetical protein n=1 Tax=Arthrobacter sp. ok909 TaxID=1761746 RepID=UPI000885FC04|nr:hypothetical protein [Arthrobacter sp. ok909]SDP33985.1 hypothetical protein SAMN04487914_108130 [Arthrobacter sp. ok909]
MKYLKELRTMLVTALAVFILMNFLVQVIQPYVPIILIGVVVITLGWYAYSRATRL